jgi:hypothetical protein
MFVLRRSGGGRGLAPSIVKYDIVASFRCLLPAATPPTLRLKSGEDIATYWILARTPARLGEAAPLTLSANEL